MQIMYIDESGDTITLSQKGKQHLVITGCIIDESNCHSIEKDFRGIKQKYYQNPDIEIKSNFLRYANPDITFDSPLKLHDRQKYNELEDDEKLLFSQSDKTIGIQIADLYCYPVYHMFEYDKKPGEYWRYDEVSQSKILSYNTKIDGVGLKYFPENTKKGLRFYT